MVATVTELSAASTAVLSVADPHIDTVSAPARTPVSRSRVVPPEQPTTARLLVHRKGDRGADDGVYVFGGLLLIPLS